ncbi:hypothetical protein FEM48_Zijuj06G0084900 [Ziziphus jujuba var. spinosa]|uniref:mannan endo-1,4-beta-mannosidase n=1 Tax=Ziziphus jujuba var. spinosa TaxID=714518 RepID=A0A978V882_ZIZJJ|nr:hypothetical protein FEM48_Zijuj06G0084900 [Ziziphus jujuba var. spinosa]
MKHYCGLVFIILLFIHNQRVFAEDGFVRTRGIQFIMNGSPFYANGFNAYWLMVVASDPSQRDKVSSAFQEAANQGLRVARTWAFSDGGYKPLQYSPGSYNEQMFKTVLTRKNSLTGIAYKDEPTIMAWELMNEPRCTSDPSGKTIQAWITEMASYVKSIDSNHLLEAGLEGFYGSSKQQINPNFQVGTDFIANNQINGIDFATVHSYPDQWLSGSSFEAQLSFLNGWVRDHIQDAQNVLKKPVLFAEFGRSLKESGYNTNQRDQIFNAVYSAIYSSARGGGAAFGGLFWQLLVEGMDSYRDGYEVILSESSSTVSLIAQESQKLGHIRRMYEKLRNIEKWKKARDIRRAQWWAGAGNKVVGKGN